MLYVCVRGVMEVVFSVCIATYCMSLSSCRCCMFVSCVHHVAVLNAAFGRIYSLLMLVEDARGDHIEEVYSRAGVLTSYR